MKNLLLILMLLPLTMDAQVGWQWAKGASGGESEGYYSATDAYGGVYATGNHWNAISFGTTTVIGAGVFLVKYDSVGNVKWAISTNSIASTSASLGLVTDLLGNEYLLGEFDTTISLGSYTLTNPSPRNNYYFLAKIDSTGNVKWLKTIGNVACTNLAQGSNCIATDLQGCIYVSCSFSNNPTVGSTSFTNASSVNSNDILVAKFDSSGSALWAKSFGGKKDEVVIGISVTASHQIYIDGYFTSDTLNFGSASLYDTSTFLLMPQHFPMFLAKLDSIGNPIWAKWSGGNGSDYVTGLATNSSEEVYVIGNYNSASISIGSYSLPFPYASNGFIAKYDTAGTVLFVKCIQGHGIIPWYIAVDPCENIWVSTKMGDGNSVDTIDGHIVTSPPGSVDPMAIVGWSSSGTYLQALALSSGGDDNTSLAIDKCGNIFVESDYEVGTFIVGSDTLILPVISEEFNFLAKYNPNLCGICYINAVKDPTPNIDVSIFPNPAVTELNIVAPNKITTITISNLIGQTIYTHQYSSPQVQVDVLSLPAGVYFIKVNGTEVRKFVKQ